MPAGPRPVRERVSAFAAPWLETACRTSGSRGGPLADVELADEGCEVEDSLARDFDAAVDSSTIAAFCCVT